MEEARYRIHKSLLVNILPLEVFKFIQAVISITQTALHLILNLTTQNQILQGG
jgi:hypothetical protein